MDFTESIKNLQQNSLRLTIGGAAASRTRFGGAPDVPADFEWPVYETDTFEDSEVKPRPLAFLAQFDLAELAPLDTDGRLPKTGLLSFFYELGSQCWGYDPTDKGCARVFWFEDTENLTPADFPQDLPEEFRLPVLGITAEAEASYPSFEDFDADDTHMKEWDDYNESLAEFGVEERGSNSHKLLGWAEIIQGSMLIECEMTSRGFNMGSGWDGMREQIDKLKSTVRDEWQLLFQLDTVEQDDFELMFGDCGRLYFYIRREDLAQRRFDRVWLIQQCY